LRPGNLIVIDITLFPLIDQFRTDLQTALFGRARPFDGPRETKQKEMTNVILYGYEGSPYYQKIKSLLALKQIPYNFVEQAPIGPRPDLLSIGVTYRRIPVLVIGKDIYFDTSLMVDVVSTKFNTIILPDEKSKVVLRSVECFASSLFSIIIECADFSSLPEVFTNDRRELWSNFGKPGDKSSSLAQLISYINNVEDNLKDGRSWLMGENISVVDINIAFLLVFTFKTMRYGSTPGLTESDIPKVYSYVERYVQHTETCQAQNKVEKISGEDAKKIILESVAGFDQVDHSESNSLSLNVGELVSLVPTDQNNVHQQKGKLVGLNAKSVSIELDNGLRVHAPRTGFRVTKE